MVWPFAPSYQHRTAFLARNRVLVALSDAVVIVQAGLPSGALGAATWARKLGKPLWVVPAAPWTDGFAGSRQLLEEGARPLVSIEALLGALALSGPLATPLRPPLAEPAEAAAALDAPPSASAVAVLAALSATPSHADTVAAKTGLTAQATAATLLTLALEDVVVESPPGFFRRRDNRNR